MPRPFAKSPSCGRGLKETTPPEEFSPSKTTAVDFSPPELPGTRPTSPVIPLRLHSEGGQAGLRKSIGPIGFPRSLRPTADCGDLPGTIAVRDHGPRSRTHPCSGPTRLPTDPTAVCVWHSLPQLPDVQPPGGLRELIPVQTRQSSGRSHLRTNMPPIFTPRQRSIRVFR